MLKSFFLLLVAAIAAFVVAQDIRVKDSVTQVIDDYQYEECVPLSDPEKIQLEFYRSSICELYTDKDCTLSKPLTHFIGPERSSSGFQPATTITGNKDPNMFFTCDIYSY